MVAITGRITYNGQSSNGHANRHRTTEVSAKHYPCSTCVAYRSRKPSDPREFVYCGGVNGYVDAGMTDIEAGCKSYRPARSKI